MSTATAPGGAQVTARGIVHIYRTEGHDVAALSGVDLDVPAGQTLALLGPSGAGKSTLLLVLAGLLRPSAGRLTVAGHDLAALDDQALDRLRGRDIGLVLQDARRNLLPYLTARENVQLALAARVEDALSADAALDVVAMNGARDIPVERLGGADQQLTALAAAVAPRPGLLLADEPTSQLPPEQTGLVVEALRRTSRELGTTVIVVTHDAALARGTDRTVTIRDGRVGAEGRDGLELSVVGPDGSLALPAHVLDAMPPGSLVRFEPLDPQDPAAGWCVVGHTPAKEIP